MLRSISAVVVCVSMGFVCARASHGQTDDGFVQPGLALADVEAEDYSAIVFVGGWGSSMYQYDFPGDYSNGRIVDRESTRLLSTQRPGSVGKHVPKLPEAHLKGQVTDTEEIHGQPMNWIEHEKAFLAGTPNLAATNKGVAEKGGSHSTYLKYELEKVSVTSFDMPAVPGKLRQKQGSARNHSLLTVQPVLTSTRLPAVGKPDLTELSFTKYMDSTSGNLVKVQVVRPTQIQRTFRVSFPSESISGGRVGSLRN